MAVQGVVGDEGRNVILARIPDGVLPNGAIVTYGRGELVGELGDVGVWGLVGREYGLLEILEAVRFCVATLCTLL